MAAGARGRRCETCGKLAGGAVVVPGGADVYGCEGEEEPEGSRLPSRVAWLCCAPVARCAACGCDCLPVAAGACADCDARLGGATEEGVRALRLRALRWRLVLRSRAVRGAARGALLRRIEALTAQM